MGENVHPASAGWLAPVAPGAGALCREPGPPGHRRLSEEIAAVIATFGERSLRLGEVMVALRGRAYPLFLLLVAIPFCTPIPLPGVSLPFGLVIAFVGLRLALNQKPWLPKRLLETTLSPGFFTRLLQAARRLVTWLESCLRPRFAGMFQTPVLCRIYGGVIMVCGLLMVLPLPIPFTNGLPALTVVLISGALLERDGKCVMAGLGIFALTLGFFGALAWSGVEGFALLKDWFGRFADQE